MKKLALSAVLFFLFAMSVFSSKLSFPVKGLVTVSSLPVFISAEWDDEWISENSSFSYNHGLARIASILATVSYTDIESEQKSNLMEQTYKILGAEDGSIDFHYDVDYSAPQGDNQAAFSFASKKIKTSLGEKTLVFVVIRGTPLNANEWISNLAVSDTTEQNVTIHEGFYRTMEQVRSALEYYLLNQKAEPKETSLFITGHSRGAAVANLLGAKLSDEKIFDTSKIFVYTFASPNVSQADDVSDPKYGFIWNIVSGEDVVPSLPPDRNSWKFKKYGKMRVLINRWTADKSKYDEEFYPAMNKIYSQFLGRDFCPFKNGTFLQSQISRVLTNIYPDINSYYKGRFKLRNSAEKIAWKIFPPSSDKKNEKIKRQNESILKNIMNKINIQTNGGVDYLKKAFVDMHAGESYLSWLFALDEDEAFSNLGSVQMILDGYYECAVFDAGGNLLARITDGIPQYKDIKVPVAAMPLPLKKTAVGFPENENFEVVIYKPSLVPTKIDSEIEFYDCEGHFIKKTKKQNFFPQIGTALTFAAGKVFLENNEAAKSKIKGKILKEKISQGKLRRENEFYVKPEFSFGIDKQISGGIDFGTKNFYGIALVSSKKGNFKDFLSLAGGIGHQNALYGNLMISAEIFGKCAWIFDDEKLGDKNDASAEKFSFVPEARFSVSFQPAHRLEIFAAGIFDFNVSGFNDGYFDSKIQQNKIGKINFGCCVQVVPSISFGVKL